MKDSYLLPVSERSHGVTRLGAAALAAITAMSLAACGQVLDFRNAEISNGKVFKAGANQPFSGTLTDVPDSKLLMGHPGWGMALNFLGRGVLGIGGDARRVLGSVCAAPISDGYVDGKVQCKLPRGTLMYEFRIVKGKLDGDFRLYDGSDDKEVVVAASFVQGQLDGKHRIFDPSTHKLRYEATYADGAIEGEEAEYNGSTAVKVASRRYSKGKLAGEVLEYAPDGKTVVFRGSYADGRPHGLHEKFDPQTGRKLAEDGYNNGTRHGPSRVWTSTGQLLHEAHFDNGMPTARPPAVADTGGARGAPAQDCVDGWMAAHRKQVGPDAPIRMDQIGEWEEWCKQGKRAS